MDLENFLRLSHPTGLTKTRCADDLWRAFEIFAAGELSLETGRSWVFAVIGTS